MAVSNSPCYIPLSEEMGEENVVEGFLTQGSTRLEMFTYLDIQFAVLMNVG